VIGRLAILRMSHLSSGFALNPIPGPRVGNFAARTR
jgi:hypothetical protein